MTNRKRKINTRGLFYKKVLRFIFGLGLEYHFIMPDVPDEVRQQDFSKGIKTFFTKKVL